VAVLVAGEWKFAQINFSYPTLYFPDLRLDGPAPLPGL
jgi:hypothetical protein